VTLFSNPDKIRSNTILEQALNCEYLKKTFEDTNIIVFERNNLIN
jgi:hypothetical protein